MNKKGNTLVIVLVAIIALVGVHELVKNTNIINTGDPTKYLNLAEFDKNKESYLGQEVTIKARVTEQDSTLSFWNYWDWEGGNSRAGNPIFVDDNGYNIFVLSDRALNRGQVYVITGIIKKDNSGSIYLDEN